MRKFHAASAILLVWMQIFLCSPVNGQQQLNVGDTLPDLVFPHMYNYTGDTLRLSDLAGKPVIFDFWSTSCSACLASFSHMDELRQQFGDKVQFIMVNKELKSNHTFGPARTHQLFERRSQLHKPAIPFITQDSSLSNLIRPLGLPCIVWMDSNRVIRHISSRINAPNVQRMLDGKAVEIEPYRGRQRYVKTLFDPQYEEYVGYHSYFSRYITGVNPGGGQQAISVSHNTIPMLFQLAYGEPDANGRSKYPFHRIGRMILEVKDSTPYFQPEEKALRYEWGRRNIYAYALNLPPSKLHRKYKYMQQDLERFFDLSAHVEKRYVKCIVMRKADGRDRLATRGGEQQLGSFSTGTISADDNFREEEVFRNTPFGMFASRLANYVEYQLKYPFVDATGYSGNIDLKLKGTVIRNPGIENLRKALKPYGLELSVEPYELEVLVVRENDLSGLPE
ncbi:TlpA family protein disulfide reductase [Chitinophaga cymbidii]|uniref:Thioredoxin domain-containing protein n=1 Tax=Chitinophaga cymbidii TaxID=1096750 RepID=A0A512RQU2_9BACT|nr:TlpA disulfide reductase family protein [Chitinophaga cymbidii]GEP98083.1 hypothetical protein CCY01nite_43430 [Chitinophaga cymbidii]